MIDYQQSYQYGLSRKEPLMGFRLQHLSDDDKFVQALRFEVLEQLCPRELVSERLEALPGLGRARRPPEPSHRGLLRHRALTVLAASTWPPCCVSWRLGFAGSGRTRGYDCQRRLRWSTGAGNWTHP
jgi:hypothetical protein